MKRILESWRCSLRSVLDGCVWGASGRSDLNRALRIAELRDGLLEGRAAVLDGRLDIYSVNVGEASRHFEAARSALHATVARLNDLGRQADAKRLELAAGEQADAWNRRKVRHEIDYRDDSGDRLSGHAAAGGR